MGTSLLASIKSAIENLHPAYFAMVMATGIVSIANDLLEMRVIGVALCWLNLIFFAILLVLTIARLIWHRTRFFCDLIESCAGLFHDGRGNVHFWQPVLIIFQASRLALALWLTWPRHSLDWCGRWERN